MNKKEIDLIVLKEYSKKHNEIFEQFLANQEQIFSNIELKEIDNKIRNLKTDIANLKFENKDTNLLELELQNANNQLKTLLKKFNINEKLLSPNYSCSFCEDTGVINGIRCVHCYMQNYFKKLVDLCGTNLKQIPSIDKIDTKIYEENEANIKDIISKICNLNTLSKNTIMFFGETGTGKTYLAKSFLKSCLKDFKYSFYVSSFVLANDLTPNADNFYNTKLQDYIDFDVLVIDDLGAEPRYKNFNERFLNLINERQEKNKITLITTNLTLKELANTYSERIFSRLMDKNISLAFKLSGKDLRIKK